MQGITDESTPGPAPGIGSGQNNLRTRVISAFIIGCVTFAIALLGGPWFSAFVLLVVAAACYEMIGMMCASGFKPPLAVGLGSTVLSFAAVIYPALPGLMPLFSLLLLGSLAYQMRHREGKPIADWAIALAGGAYLGWTGGHLAAIRQLNEGLWWLTLAIGTTWMADSGAYFFGRRFGRHKLAPKLSPNKTWEGYLGGVLTAVGAGLIIGLLSPMGIWHSVVAAFLTGSLGTMGDLTESIFKRQAEAKDSGHLIPGHGGAFDRIDSLLWAGVVVFYYATLIFR